ncbi:hypothetical protein V1506DRAFT_71157 [Lipomyces tetrasporus]
MGRKRPPQCGIETLPTSESTVSASCAREINALADPLFESALIASSEMGSHRPCASRIIHEDQDPFAAHRCPCLTTRHPEYHRGFPGNQFSTTSLVSKSSYYGDFAKLHGEGNSLAWKQDMHIHLRTLRLTEALSYEKSVTEMSAEEKLENENAGAALLVNMDSAYKRYFLNMRKLKMSGAILNMSFL